MLGRIEQGDEFFSADTLLEMQALRDSRDSGEDIQTLKEEVINLLKKFPVNDNRPPSELEINQFKAGHWLFGMHVASFGDADLMCYYFKFIKNKFHNNIKLCQVLLDMKTPYEESIWTKVAENFSAEDLLYLFYEFSYLLTEEAMEACKIKSKAVVDYVLSLPLEQEATKIKILRAIINQSGNNHFISFAAFCSDHVDVANAELEKLVPPVPALSQQLLAWFGNIAITATTSLRGKVNGATPEERASLLSLPQKTYHGKNEQAIEMRSMYGKAP
jgi:hypothetical protein